MRLQLTNDKRILSGLGLALGAALATGGSNVIGRMVVTDLATPLVTSAFALLFGNIAVLLFSHRKLRSFHAPRKDLMFMVLAGLASGVGVISFLFALSLAPVVLVSPIGSVYPLIVLIFSALFLRRMELVTSRVVVGTLVVILGVVLVILGRYI